MLVPRAPSLLREKDSNLRPCGYEPRELPLLYPAILNLIYDNFFKLPNIFFGGDDETRTRVLQRTNNTSISHVYLVFLN